MLRYGFEFSVSLQHRLESGHLNTTIVAMDAYDYRRGGAEFQYTTQAVDREAAKAYCAFMESEATSGCAEIATGTSPLSFR